MLKKIYPFFGKKLKKCNICLRIEINVVVQRLVVIKKTNICTEKM